MDKKQILLGALSASLLGSSCYAFALNAAPEMGLFKKKKKTELPTSDYKKIVGSDSVNVRGVMNVIRKGEDFYLEMPTQLMGRVFLVSNKLQRVPNELNEAGVNRGINYENQCIRFEWDKTRKAVFVRQQRNTPEVDEKDAMAASVKSNYIDPLIASLKVEAVAKDSSTVIFKVNDLFNGKKNYLNDVFNLINLGTSADSDLSHIIDIKAFSNNVTATSELTTVVHEGKSKTNVTVEVSSSLVLLPEVPMVARKENQRVGYFTTSRLQYGDKQQEVERNNYITRWRLEPKDEEAYLRGELVEPKKPIVFYIDQAVPEFLRPYIKKGMTDWNVAFEKAGFKNAVQVFDLTDSIASEGDDMKYSVLTYDASEKANAMGPSVIDPRTGEILEADIIWWHNVKSLLREWIMVQTGAYNKEARQYELPDSLIGDAARFVACHEVGHSLGLRHNMIASNAYPTDSLRSKSFTGRVGGTAASIMDYARFNYVAQPGDGIKMISPHIGPYDMMAIEWGYRWYPLEKYAAEKQDEFLKKHSGKEYRYSEAQSQRTAIDPRALSEDLGDDAMKSARYGIENLKRVMPNIVDWTRTGEPGQSYDEASKLYQGVIFQWSLYLYHVLANVGGMYIDNTTIDDGKPTFNFVEKDKQKRAVQFLIDEVFTYPKWLFRNELTKYTFINKNTPLGVQEQAPDYALQNQQSYMLWDMLDNNRLMRMFANEQANGKNAFTAIEMMDMLHKHIFAGTIAGRTLGIDEREMQKNFVDALITAAAQQEGVKINKKLYDTPAIIDSPEYNWQCQSLSTASRNIDMGGTQTARVSDAISVKRGELVRILNLLKGKRNSGDTATKFHYEDVIMRIQTALGQAIK